MRLFELSMRANVSPTWVNSLQRKTGIPGPVGVQGVPGRYSDGDVNIIRQCRVLRSMGYTFEEIGEMWDNNTNKIKDDYKDQVIRMALFFTKSIGELISGAI